jgi:hypothetical protein
MPKTESYFASDGSFGDADDFAVVDTSSWTDSDWEEIEDSYDWERPAVARAIASKYAKETN